MTKPSSVLAKRFGIRTTRGKERGACTTARPARLPKASLPSSATIKFKLLLATFGNGWAGSSAIGVSSGSNSVRKIP